MRASRFHSFLRTTAQIALAATISVAPFAVLAQNDPNAAPPMSNSSSVTTSGMPMHHTGHESWLKGLGLV